VGVGSTTSARVEVGVADGQGNKSSVGAGVFVGDSVALGVSVGGCVAAVIGVIVGGKFTVGACVG
jgi:hypothetical protein